MRTITMEGMERTHCPNFDSMCGNSAAVCSNAVMDRSDFLHSEIVCAEKMSGKRLEGMAQAPLVAAVVSPCEDLAFVCIDEPEPMESLRNILISEIKETIRFLSLFTVEPLMYMLPSETIEHFRRLIAGFKLTLRNLENA